MRVSVSPNLSNMIYRGGGVGKLTTLTGLFIALKTITSKYRSVKGIMTINNHHSNLEKGCFFYGRYAVKSGAFAPNAASSIA